MFKTTVMLCGVLGGVLMLTGPAQAVGDAKAGKVKSQVCIGCHGPSGNSVNPVWPKLAGQHASYTAKQLAEFKSGKRKDPVMSSQAVALTEADMADLGAYYAKQTITAGAAEAGLLDSGQRIYRGGNSASGVAACISCHGPTGAGNPAAKFPSLGGQQAAYVEKTMRDFRSGTRSNDSSKMMRDIARLMTDKEIKEVASYIAGLH